MNRFPGVTLPICCGALCLAAAALAQSESPSEPQPGSSSSTPAEPSRPTAGEPLRAGAWQPPIVDASRVQRIVAGNLFAARGPPGAGPAAGVVPPPNTDDPPPPPEVDAPPPDPDARFALIGVSGTEDQLVAFIEDTSSGEVFRVTRDQAFSVGEIVGVGLDRLSYRVGDEVRLIALGESLLYATPGADAGDTQAPADAEDAAPDAPASDADTPAEINVEARSGEAEFSTRSGPDARRAELLEQMRERRERQQQQRRR